MLYEILSENLSCSLCNANLKMSLESRMHAVLFVFKFVRYGPFQCCSLSSDLLLGL